MNIDEFAKLIGVSRGTVTRAVHGTGRISPITREMVLRRMEELGYRPNRLASALVTGKTDMIALWASGFYPAYSAHIIDLARQEVLKDGYELHVSAVPDGAIRRADLKSTDIWPVDGVMVFDSPDYLNAYLDSHPTPDMPFVGVGPYYSQRTDYVGIDISMGATEAVEHLVKIGCKRIAHVLTPRTNWVGDARRTAYTKVVTEAGQRPEYINVPLIEDDISASTRQALQEIIDTSGCPDALFCVNDYVAMGAYRGLRDRGIRIPDDVAIVGCDGIREVEYFDPPLSTITLPGKEMCQLAWHFLQERMSDPSIPQQKVILESHLTVRGSSSR